MTETLVKTGSQSPVEQAPVEQTQLGAHDRSVVLTLRPGHDHVEVMALWKQLEQSVPNVGLACSFDWTDVWLNHYGDVVPHEFALLHDQDGRLRSVVLLTTGVGQKDGPVPLKTLHVGTAGELDADSACVEYNQILVDPNYRDLVVNALIREFDGRSGIDQWNLDGFEESAAALFAPSDDSSWEVQTEAAHWFDLATARERGDQLIDTYRSSHRRKIRKNLAEFEDLRVEWADTVSHATEVFDEMIQMHQQRWIALGKPGSYASQRFTHFHEELLTRLVPEQRMSFARVVSGENTVGSIQLFNENNRALLYQSGWSPQTGQISPGVVVDFLSMQECLQRGFDAFDFLGFENQHKRMLANQSTNLVWVRRKRTKLKFAVVKCLRQARSWLRRNSTKQS
jgi:CelD/BcsL family acetyltransferase involved in cellulose biosynthesis